MNNLLKVLLFFWQLPQHFLAQILLIIFRRKITKIERYNTSIVYWMKDIKWGISLGQFIILSEKYHDENTVKHEYGHSIQSMRWGLFYLIVVGLPSISMNILSTILYSFGKKTFALNYYKRWPETEADKLGMVDRPDRNIA